MLTQALGPEPQLKFISRHLRPSKQSSSLRQWILISVMILVHDSLLDEHFILNIMKVDFDVQKCVKTFSRVSDQLGSSGPDIAEYIG